MSWSARELKREGAPITWLTLPQLVCLITTGDAAGVAQVGKWRLGPQSFAAALAITRRVPVVAGRPPAAGGGVALLGRKDLLGVGERGLPSLVRGGAVEWARAAVP